MPSGPGFASAMACRLSMCADRSPCWMHSTSLLGVSFTRAWHCADVMAPALAGTASAATAHRPPSQAARTLKSRIAPSPLRFPCEPLRPQHFAPEGACQGWCGDPIACRSEIAVAILRAMAEQALIEQGESAPDFELPDQDGNPVRLSELRGRPVVLYFYPKADTPGCTTQACGVRDHLPDYENAGAVVLGVSPDPVKAVKKFHDKQGLNFTLLADEDHAVCERYGVWAEKSMYGRTYWGAQRATFIIDDEGVIRHVIPKVSPKTHDDEVLAAIGALA